jgi:hypothetical protein
MLPDIDSEEYFIELAKWGIAWIKLCLSSMKTDKEKILAPGFMNIFREINEKIIRKQENQYDSHICD